MRSRIHVLEYNLPDSGEIGQESSPTLPRILVLNGGSPTIKYDIQLPVMLIHQVFPESGQYLIDPPPILIRGIIEIDVRVLCEENDGLEVRRIDCR